MPGSAANFVTVHALVGRTIGNKDDINSASDINSLSQKKPILVFPSNDGHHRQKGDAPLMEKISQEKSGGGLADLAAKYHSEKKGYTLGLPTTGVDDDPNSIKQAMLDLCCAVGAGYPLAIPVRAFRKGKLTLTSEKKHGGPPIFDKSDILHFATEDGSAYEPKFYGGVQTCSRGKQQALAKMYAAFLNLIIDYANHKIDESEFQKGLKLLKIDGYIQFETNQLFNAFKQAQRTAEKEGVEAVECSDVKAKPKMMASVPAKENNKSIKSPANGLFPEKKIDMVKLCQDWCGESEGYKYDPTTHVITTGDVKMFHVKQDKITFLEVSEKSCEICADIFTAAKVDALDVKDGSAEDRLAFLVALAEQNDFKITEIALFEPDKETKLIHSRDELITAIRELKGEPDWQPKNAASRSHTL